MVYVYLFNCQYFNRHDITEILLKVALNITSSQYCIVQCISRPHRWCNGYHLLFRVRLIVGRAPGQTKDHRIGICFFTAEHAALRSKNKDCMALNQDVSEWSHMSTRGLLFQYGSTIKIQLRMLV